MEHAPQHRNDTNLFPRGTSKRAQLNIVNKHRCRAAKATRLSFDRAPAQNAMPEAPWRPCFSFIRLLICAQADGVTGKPPAMAFCIACGGHAATAELA